MKRVLFMHQASVVGGGSYCLLNVVKNIDRSVLEPIVVLKDDGPLVDELKKLGVEVILFNQMADIPYNMPFLKKQSIKKYISIRRSIPLLKDLLKRNRIDILYLNNMMLCRYLQPAKECGCKTIVHVREHWPLNEHIKQFKWAQKCVYQYADKMIAINGYSASMFPQKKATIVYDWIDFKERYENYPFQKIFGVDASRLKVFLFTGGLAPIKGAYEVIKAFETVNRDANSRLLMMGFTKEITGTKWKKILKKLLLIAGMPTYDCKVKKLAKKDSRIVCIPGNYKIKHIIEQSYCMLSYYTIPHANLAMAESIILGTPVIAAETEESLEYACGGKAAILYKFKSQEEFRKSISCIDEKIPKLKDEIEKNKATLEEKFSPSKNIAALNTVINSLFD